MAHGLEGGVERERLRTMVAMASIFLDRDTKACQFRNGVRKGPLVIYNSENSPLTMVSAPGETARERRHPSEARLESSFYAQFPV